MEPLVKLIPTIFHDSHESYVRMFAQTVAVSLIVFSGALARGKPALAKDPVFVCGTSKGVPATIAQTDHGNVTLIRWSSSYFSQSGWTPQRRCEAVSERFQDFYQQGTLKYLTTGRENGYAVVCVAQQENYPCLATLFTVKHYQEASQRLNLLQSVRYRASGPLDESPGREYFNIEEFLRTAPADPDASVAPVRSLGNPAW